MHLCFTLRPGTENVTRSASRFNCVEALARAFPHISQTVAQNRCASHNDPMYAT